MAGPIRRLMNAFRFGAAQPNPAYEAASNGRRLRGFQPSRQHVNAAIKAAGPTLVARARWLYKNDGYAANGVNEWTSAAVGDGVKPRPRVKPPAGKRVRGLTPKAIAKKKAELLDLFWQWTEEADADGLADFFGQQEKLVRETYLAGECFVRIRSRRPGDMLTVPFQLQILPSEMLDTAFDATLNGGGYVRQGVEFNGIGKRVAYHFFRWHPGDEKPMGVASLRERVRVPAEDVIHVMDVLEAGQIRGAPRIASVLIKLFTLETYDDAELDRKKTAALFAGFLTGRGEAPIGVDPDGEDEADDIEIGDIQPGALIDLGDRKDIKFSTPAESGQSYEPFQYRTLLKVASGMGVPYAYLTGDVTRGNFSNVRTEIIRFRRRISQWQNNTLIFQFCRRVWTVFVERAVLAGLVELPGYDENPAMWHACDWLPPRGEWVDPAKDVKAEKEAVDAGFKSRTQVIAERGYDREDIDAEIAEERAGAKALGLDFAPAAKGTPEPEPAEDEQPQPGSEKLDA